jgi:primary-amine oxidase
MRSRSIIELLCVWLLADVARAQSGESPFEPLSVAEQRSAFEVVLARFRADPALPHEPLHFPLVALLEPPKAQVLALREGQKLQRRAEVQVLHHPDNRTWVAIVDLSGRRVAELSEVRGQQPAIAGEEYTAADKLVRAYEPWLTALRRRKLDPALAYLDVWATSTAELSGEALARASHGTDTRLLRVLTFLKQPAKGAIDAPYDRPVEGLVVTLDMNARRGIECLDSGVRPVSSESGRATNSSPLKPQRISEPQGSELTVQGQLVRYRDWQFYAVLRPREGLVLYDVCFRDHGRLRRIAYRLSLSEIYVPYGLPEPGWVFRQAFDVGEYNAGLSAQRLELGLDVPDNARLLDATLFNDLGPSPENPDGKLELPGTLGIYERPSGLLWTRTDPSTRIRDSRAGRELVATWNCWIGNYVYAFEWIFKLDGSIEVRAQLHGTTLNRGASAGPEPGAVKVGKDAHGVLVSAPHHQHFLSFRLDLDIDGSKNQLMEMEVAHLEDARFKNAFDTRTLQLPREGSRDVDPAHARHWHVESSTAKNAFGKPTGYALEPDSLAFPYSAPDFSGLARAAFAQHALWFTRQHDAERYVSGEFPNQAPPGTGIAAYAADQEALRGQDVVLWYTTGFTHVARPEDYPVMSVESVGFKLQPRGFFDRNPALGVGAWR